MTQTKISSEQIEESSGTPLALEIFVIVCIVALMIMGVVAAIASYQCDNACDVRKSRLISWTCHCKTKTGWEEFTEKP